ncbi:hypothetical protein GF415_00270 [Candidatus Micrarchaeota archaeon]|nr:hypothetical protein [Candidatus Micrarchaeota archaeon]
MAQQKASAWKLVLGFCIFTIAGILHALLFPLSGLTVLAPLLLGPGLTILLFGLFYESSLGILLGFGEGELSSRIKTSYILLGGLFCIMGMLAWFFG